jgi:hypothetical protein
MTILGRRCGTLGIPRVVAPRVSSLRRPSNLEDIHALWIEGRPVAGRCPAEWNGQSQESVHGMPSYDYFQIVSAVRSCEGGMDWSNGLDAH